MAGSELDSGEADTPPGTARSITIKMPRTNSRTFASPSTLQFLGQLPSSWVLPLQRAYYTGGSKPCQEDLPPASRRGTKHPTPFGGSKVEAFVTVAYCSQIPPRFQIGTVKARGGGGPKGCPFERSPYTPRTSAGNGVGRLDYQEATEK